MTYSCHVYCDMISLTMKTDRLIGILSVLLQSKKTTAPELAELFEVSRRTINRDIEDLCKAGIPIMTTQGVEGGICIMEGYRMDRTILSSKDMKMILAGLRSLDSVSGSNYYSLLMEKLQLGSSHFLNGRDSILIDLSSWHRESLAPKIEIIEDAIDNRHLLSFDYFSPSGKTSRIVEPYYLIFRWSSWYLYGWCSERKDFRLFKLNRMLEVRQSDQTYESRNPAQPDLSDEKIFPKSVKVKALFDEDMDWRLIEEFGIDSFTKTDNGKLLFNADCSDVESITTWFMTFGDKVRVIEPEEIKRRICDISKRILESYEEQL